MSPFSFLHSQEAPRRDTKCSQLLREAISISTIQASTDVGKQLIESIGQLSLVLWRLGAQKVVPISGKAGLARQHQT